MRAEVTLGGRFPPTPAAGAGDEPLDEGEPDWLEERGAGAGDSWEHPRNRQATTTTTGATAGRAPERALPLSNNLVTTVAILNERRHECQCYSRWLTQEM